MLVCLLLVTRASMSKLEQEERTSPEIYMLTKAQGGMSSLVPAALHFPDHIRQ